MAGNCIFDDEACCNASKQEIIRRYYQEMCNIKRGTGNNNTLFKLELLMKQVSVSPNDRIVVNAALQREADTGHPAVAIELPNGKVITGKTSDLLGSSAAALMNALKELGEIDHDLHLIAPSAIEPIQTLKTDYLGSKNPRLHTDEILIALSMCAANDSNAKHTLAQIPKLKQCEVHSSVLLSSVDEQVFKRLGVHLTCEPKYELNDKKYHK